MREAPDLQVVEEAFALTDLPAADDLTARTVVTTTDATEDGSARNDMILVHVTNTSDRAKQVTPTLVVDTALAFEAQPANQKLVVQDHETITCSRKLLDVKTIDDTRRVVRLEEFTIEPKRTATFFVL
jgi:hypothetical protein